MKLTMLAAGMCLAMLDGAFAATDYYWRATEAGANINGSGDSSVLANWNVKDGDDYVAATQLPQNGDVVVFDNRLYKKAFAPMADFNAANQEQGLGGIVFTGTGYVKNGSWSVVWGASELYIAGDGFLSNGVANATGPMVWANMNVVGPGAGVVFGSVAGGTWSQVRTVKGTAPIIVNGPGLVRLIEYNNNSNANAPHDADGSTHYKNYSLQVPELILRGEADIRTWWKLTNTVVRFDADAAKLTVGWQQAAAGYHDLFLGNGSYIAETAANLTGGHAINASRAATLHVKDTPGAATQTFTGKLTGQASFDFDPTPSGCSFVFSGAASDTTGELIVSNGTVRLSGGATFRFLSGVTVAAGGTLKVDEGSGAGFRGGALTLASGGVIDAGADVYLAFASGTLGGAALADGIYTKDNAPTWVSGEGTVGVGVAWPGEKADIWNREDFPAVLAAGKTWWRGMSLTGNDMELTAADGAAAVLGPAGIVTGGEEKGYTCRWPLQLFGDLAWTMSGKDRLYQYAPLMTFAPGELSLSASLAGGISLMVPNPGLFHDIAISNGTVNVAADNALGRGTTYFDGTKAHLNLFGVELDGPIVCTVNDTSKASDYLYGLANKTNVFNGCYSMAYAGHAAVRGAAGTHYVFRGGFTKPRGYINIYSDVTVTNTPMAMGSGAVALLGGATLTLAVPGNDPGSNNFQLGAGQRLRTTAPYALDASKATIKLNMNVEGSGMTTFDLCGCDQSVTYLKGGPYSTVTSGVQAVLHVTTDSDYADDLRPWGQTAYTGGVPTNYVCFAGGASLSVDGKGYMRISGYSSTTGTLAVAGGGRVQMAASQPYPPDGKTYRGMWPNARAVTVRKGTLDVEHADAFGPDTTVRFEGAEGVIELDEGVLLKVAALEIDGVAQAPGLYGGAASGARFKPTVDGTYRFAGTGLLLVPGGGTLFIFR